MGFALKSRLMPLAALSVAVVLVLVGCSSRAGDSDATGTGPDTKRTVTDVTGTNVEIPTHPHRVVALDEPAALNLLAMGIKPAAVFQAWKTVVPAEVIKSLDIEVLTTAGYYPKLEEVAALQPDLIVISTSPARVKEVPDYSSISPTLRAVFQGGAAELAQTWGDYFDEPERATTIEHGLTTLATTIAGKQYQPARSLSALQSYGGSGDASLYYMAPANPLHSIIAAADFDRPKLQDAANEDSEKYGGWAPFSPETLPNHDADIIAVLSSPQYNPKGVTGLPLFMSLKGQPVEVDGDFWSGGSLFYAYWVLCDLQTFVNGKIVAGGSADATERWQAFTTMIGG